MLTLEELGELIGRYRGLGECFRECYDAYSNNLLQEIGDGSGKGTARYFLGIYKIKELTSRRAHIRTCGFDMTLERLSMCPPDEIITLRPLVTSDRSFMVFVSESNQLVGCIGVDRRNESRAKKDLDKLMGFENT